MYSSRCDAQNPSSSRNSTTVRRYRDVAAGCAESTTRLLLREATRHSECELAASRMEKSRFSGTENPRPSVPVAGLAADAAAGDARVRLITIPAETVANARVKPA